MSEVCCREKYLDEYISELEIDKNLKKRMIELCHRTEEENIQKDKYLQNCHKRIDELEQTVIELSTELAKAKRFMREQK